MVLTTENKCSIMYLHSQKNICSRLRFSDAEFHYRDERNDWGDNKMRELIKGYEQSCIKVKTRIDELNHMKREFMKQGNEHMIAELDLERRIKILYSDFYRMRETADYLASYVRRVEQREKTRSI